MRAEEIPGPPPALRSFSTRTHGPPMALGLLFGKIAPNLVGQWVEGLNLLFSQRFEQMVLSSLDLMSGPSHRVATFLETMSSRRLILFLCLNVCLGAGQRGSSVSRGSSAQGARLSFLPALPARPACLPPSPGTSGSVPGSAFLSMEPLVSSCNESQPQLSSCQTGFFKNISVFTQHELISLQCPWGLIGGRGCALGTPPHPVLKCQYHLWEPVARLPPLPSARPMVLARTGS